MLNFSPMFCYTQGLNPALFEADLYAYTTIFSLRTAVDGVAPGMWRRLMDFARERWPWRHRLPISNERVDALVEAFGASEWHGYALRKRLWRRHVCIACGWIADYAPRTARVFEPGCGGGANLLWLAERGFSNLSGADIDSDALGLCRAFQKELGCSFPVWADNCMKPDKPLQEQDIILSVNWLYHVPGSSLDDFLRCYIPYLSPKGGFVLDVVDSSYNTVKDNAYHTSDGHLPSEKRRPSEYTFRMSVEEVEAAAARHGLRVLRHASTWSRPQRRVFILRRA